MFSREHFSLRHRVDSAEAVRNRAGVILTEIAKRCILHSTTELRGRLVQLLLATFDGVVLTLGTGGRTIVGDG